MHALHFTFGLGAFLAPVISRPFLVNEENLDHSESEVKDITDNSTVNSFETKEIIENSTWTIKALYPLVAAYALLLSLGFIVYFIIDFRKANAEQSESKTKDDNEKRVEEALSEKVKYISVGLLAVFFFLYVGMEVAFGTFISVFAVESDLKFTRPQGSDVTAIFWGSFAGTRGIAIFLAIIAKPEIIMWSSFATCIIGTVILSSYAGSSALILYIGTSLMGIGMASIFATGFLWVEKRMTVTNKISSVFIIASSAGADVFPVLVGQLVETSPMVFIHLTTGIVGGCVLMFAVISLIANSAATVVVDEQEQVELKEEKRTYF